MRGGQEAVLNPVEAGSKAASFMRESVLQPVGTTGYKAASFVRETVLDPVGEGTKVAGGKAAVFVRETVGSVEATGSKAASLVRDSVLTPVDRMLTSSIPVVLDRETDSEADPADAVFGTACFSGVLGERFETACVVSAFSAPMALEGEGAQAPGLGMAGPLVDADPIHADAPLRNAAAVAGRLVHIARGRVPFEDKVRRAEEAGALGIVFGNRWVGSFYHFLAVCLSVCLSVCLPVCLSFSRCQLSLSHTHFLFVYALFLSPLSLSLPFYLYLYTQSQIRSRKLAHTHAHAYTRARTRGAHTHPPRAYTHSHARMHAHTQGKDSRNAHPATPSNVRTDTASNVCTDTRNAPLGSVHWQ